VRHILVLTALCGIWLAALLVPAVLAPCASASGGDVVAYAITDTTLIILDGNVVQLADLPPYTETINMSVDPTAGVVIRLELRSVQP
jgi:hypothetical protein